MNKNNNLIEDKSILIDIKDINIHIKRVVNAGQSQNLSDYVTKQEVKEVFSNWLS